MVQRKVYIGFWTPEEWQHVAHIRLAKPTQGFNDNRVAPAVPIEMQACYLRLYYSTFILTIHVVDS